MPTFDGNTRSPIGSSATTGFAIGTCVLATLLFAPPARALVPFPDPLRPEAPVTAPPPSPELMEHAPAPSLTPTPRPFGGVSFNLVDRSQTVRLTRQTVAGISLPNAKAHDEATSYLAGLDLYLGAYNLTRRRWGEIDPDEAYAVLILEGAAGFTEASTTAGDTSTSTGGPALSIGTQISVGSKTFSLRPNLPKLRLFAATSFDFSNASFDDLDGWSSAYRIEPNVGIVADYRFYLYAGAAWEYLTPAQSGSVTVDGVRLPLRFRVEEDEPWSAVVGVIYRNALRVIALPGVDVVLEGDIGGRSQVQFTLRYELSVGG